MKTWEGSPPRGPSTQQARRRNILFALVSVADFRKQRPKNLQLSRRRTLPPNTCAVVASERVTGRSMD